MRREELYLADIIDAADAIATFISTVDRETFLHDDMRQSAVLQKLIVIGEAASRLPAEFHDRYTDIEWADVVGFRNIAVHAYFDVNWSIVWITATQDVPTLRAKIVAIVAQEYPDLLNPLDTEETNG